MQMRLNRLVAAMVPAIGMTVLGPATAADPKAERQGSARAQSESSSRPAARQAAMRDVRMSQVIGMDVRNTRGENLGEINDLMVDPQTGRVQYGIVGFGGFMGVGEKLFAFPFTSFKVTDMAPRAAAGTRGTTDRSPGNPMDNDGVRGDKGPIGSDRTADRRDVPARADASRPADRPVAARAGGDVHLVLDVDRDRLKNAPGFERNHWPDWGDAKFRGQVDQFGRTDRRGGTAAQASNRLVRASQMLDANVRDASDRDIGDVEDIVVDMRSGQARYAVVEFDKAWSLNDKLVAVPMRALRAGERDGKDVKDVVLDADRSRLERAPAFSKNDWPDLNQGRYRSDVDQYLSAWGRAGEGRASAQQGTASQRTSPAAGVGGGPRSGAASGTAGGSGTSTAGSGNSNR